MGFHVYTDAWWRNPKNAVTTEATIVEVRKRKRFGGNEFRNAGYYNSVVADVSDPETGQVVRASNDELYSGLAPFQVGQRVRVRWSAKRKYFERYGWNTAPEGDSGGAQLATATAAAGTAQASAAAPTPEQAARVQQVLGGLGLGGISDVQVISAQEPADHPAPLDNPPAQEPSDRPPPISQLGRLAALHRSGALTDAEFEQQKRRILGES